MFLPNIGENVAGEATCGSQIDGKMMGQNNEKGGTL